MKLYRIEDADGVGMYAVRVSYHNRTPLHHYAHATMTGSAHPNPVFDGQLSGPSLSSKWEKKAKELQIDKNDFRFAFSSIDHLKGWIGRGNHSESEFCDEPGTVPEWLFALGAVVVEYECPDEFVLSSNRQSVFVFDEAVRVREIAPEEWI